MTDVEKCKSNRAMLTARTNICLSTVGFVVVTKIGGRCANILSGFLNKKLGCATAKVMFVMNRICGKSVRRLVMKLFSN